MKTALITGASSGIGAGAARHLAHSGYRVILVARRQTELAQIASQIGHGAIAETCDAASSAQVLALGERVCRLYGTPDVIVHCAGAGQWKRIEDTTPDEALFMTQAPYLAAFNVTHLFMRNMLERGSGVIIHVNSPASVCPWRSSVGYASSRWALRGLHEALCQDLAGTGVRSCHIVFGRTDGSYFEHNGVSAASVPMVAATIRTLATDECGRIIAHHSEHPKRDAMYPFTLRMYAWIYRLAPNLVRWILRRSRADPLRH